MPDQQIFFDPQRKRWKRLRRILDTAAVVSTLVLAGFIFNVLRNQQLPELLLPTPRHNYKRLARPPASAARRQRTSAPRAARPPASPPKFPSTPAKVCAPPTTCRTTRPATPRSRSTSTRSICCFPQWLHVDAPSGTLMVISGDNHREYPVIDGATVHDPDDAEQGQAGHSGGQGGHRNLSAPQQLQPAHPELGLRRRRCARRIRQERRAAPADHALSHRISRPIAAFRWTLKASPTKAMPAYLSFIQELYGHMHARNLRLYVNAAVSTTDSDLKQIAANSDGIVLMNYDEHQTTSDPGPDRQPGVVCRQPAPRAQDRAQGKADLRHRQLRLRLDALHPQSQRTAAIPSPQVLNTEDFPSPKRGSAPPTPTPISTSITTPSIRTSNTSTRTRTSATWCGFSMASRCSNEMRAARELGLQTFALWRLGEEDSSLWNIWDKPSDPDSLQALGAVQPGHDVDTEGEGDILRVTGLPQPGKRTVEVDTDEPDPRKKLIVDEHMDVYPRTYTIEQYGYHPNEVALTFDDGPDPKWTPKILDILKARNVKGTFMIIGAEAAENIGLMQRVVREGHEIGNHTYTHPDISEISPRQVDLEINLTERLFASKLGVQPLYFRPPYDIDEEPDTDDQAAPAWRIQQMGYTIIGSKIDTDDWNEHPRKTPAEMIQSVLAQLDTMKAKPQFRGSIILHARWRRRPLGHRRRAGPLIDALRAHGYTIVPVSALMGKTTAQVMPPLTFWQRMRALPDSIAFSGGRIIGNFIVHGLLRGRRAHERAPHHRRSVRRHRPSAQAVPPGLARLQPPRRRSHPGL